MNEPLVINATEKQPASKARLVLIVLGLIVFIGGAVLIGIGQKNLLGNNSLPSDPAARAIAILQQNALVDAGNFVAAKWQAAYGGAVYNTSVDFYNTATLPGNWATDIGRLTAGEVGAQFFSVFPSCESAQRDAFRQAAAQIDVINKVNARYSGTFQPATSAVQIGANFDTTNRAISSVISIRGGHAIDGSLAGLRALYNLGARSFSLFAGCGLLNNVANPIGSAAGAGADTGLTAFGRAVVVEANRLGMLVDLTGASATTIKQAIALSSAPVVFTAAGASDAKACMNPSNLNKQQLIDVAAAGGVVAVSFNPAQLTCTGTAAVSDIVDTLRFITDVQGSTTNVALGSSFDSFVASYDSSVFPALVEAMFAKFNDQEVIDIVGGNLLRVLTSAANSASLTSAPQEELTGLGSAEFPDTCRTAN